MQITGKCHCGKISYRAQIDPEKISLCHCTDCQVLTGCAYRVSAKMRVEDFQLLSGEPTLYVKKADSGAKRVQAFCGHCGSHLYAEALESPKIRSLRVGSIEQRALLTPRQQIWCRSALPWVENLSGIAPKYAEQESPAVV